VCALPTTPEDTSTPPGELEAAFGRQLADGVSALTKNPSLDKPAAMRDSLDRILRQPAEVAMVKLADRITNLAPPPPRWTVDKISAYRAEAVLIADTLGAASSLLAARLRQRIARYGR
jgi:(p)ppGpp synthase/HD superfamily hydrolase